MKFYAICSVVVLGLFIYGGTGDTPIIKAALNNKDTMVINTIDYDKEAAENALDSLVGRLNKELYPFYDEDSGKIGYLDKYGKIKIKPQFDIGQQFDYGYAIVGIDDKKGIIEPDKDVVKIIKDDNNFEISSNRESINKLVKKISEYEEYKVGKRLGAYGIKDKDGNFIVKPKYKEIKLMESNDLKDRFPEVDVNYDIFVGNYAVVNNGEKDILVNKDGEEIKDLKHKVLKLDDDFILGYDSIDSKKVNIVDLKDKKNYKEFLEVLFIDKDRAIVKSEKGYLIIDNKGNAISDIYENVHISHRSINKFIFSDNNKTYILNRDGKKEQSIDKSYDEFEMYSSNLYLGKMKDKGGEYLNSNGDIIGYYK